MLRHRHQLNDLSAVDRSVEKREVIPKFKEPTVVQFRRDGDMNGVVEAVRAHKSVDVCAAVGSGKSTKVPLLLSKSFGCLVVHTIPFHISARRLSEYLTSQIDGDKFVYMDDEFSDLPQHGVVIMTNATLFACLVRGTFTGVRDSILVLDESHESDAWTAVIRRVANAIPHFRCVVRASGTMSPGSDNRPDLPGKREIKTYSKCAVTSWRTDDHDKPWAASNITGNTVIAIDRVDVRVRLAAEYQQHGFDVRLCDSKTDYDYYRESERRMADRNHGIVILIVDYSYRSSLTIPQVTTIIDSCEVAIPTVDKKRPVTAYRQAYDFEVQQFLARASRIPGESSTLWRSINPSPKMMCDLEALECDAANLLYRLLGFRPPIELITYDYFEGPVPLDIAAAMYSDHPLTLCPPESRGPWINGDLPCIREKEESEYQYELTKTKRTRYASCHTMNDYDRPVTPPPPVPDHYRRTRVDPQGLAAHRSTRDSSPSLETVFTLKSDFPDNLSLFEEGSDHAVFQKPKRVAKHRQLEIAAAAAAKAEAEPSNLPQEAALGMRALDAALPSLPVEPAVSDSLAKPEEVKGAAVSRMKSVVHGATFIHDNTKVSKVQDDGFRMPDEHLGKYIYYHDMDKAPEQSNYFFRGVESVLKYCEQHNAKRYIGVLPESEKLYAMKLLVDMYNESTAVAMGIQRLFQEMSGRPPDQWQSIVNHDQLIETLDWMTAQSTEAQLRVRHCRDVMPYFMVYDIDFIPAATELEHRVMVTMMEKVEHVAVKKDPDKAAEYMRRLNDRAVKVNPRSGRPRTMIAYK